MRTEFEEKDFEGPLYRELLFGNHRIVTPGQVFEGTFGVDAALLAEHPLFWDLIGYQNIPSGVVLNDLRWGFMWRKLGRKRVLPTFNTNLLIQAKRCKYLIQIPSVLKNYGFSDEYWRFEINVHQQEILQKVSAVLRKRALLIYASPAFHTLDLLYKYTESGQIYKNTSYVKVEKLKNHKHWSYYQGGTTGVAQSEPEFIEGKSFELMLKEYMDNDMGFPENLRFLHETVVSCCKALQERNPLAKYFLNLYKRMQNFQQLEQNAIDDYVSFKLFCKVMKLKWLMF